MESKEFFRRKRRKNIKPDYVRQKKHILLENSYFPLTFSLYLIDTYNRHEKERKDSFFYVPILGTPYWLNAF